MDRVSRSVASLFCDDIRPEVGNKLSLMGVYLGGMFVPDFPVVLPKLCVMVTIITPLDQPFKSLGIRLMNNVTVFFQHTIPDALLKDPPAPAPIPPTGWA